MKKFLILILIMGMAAGGCRSREKNKCGDALPEEKIKLSVNVEEAVPTPEAGKKPIKKRTARVAPAANTKQLPAAAKNAGKPAEVTSVDGDWDGSLNDVEQSYIREIKKRNQQQVKTNESRVFGSFSSTDLFKSGK